MFSYLKLLQEHVDSSIIKRGQKIFLDGGVQKLVNLEIDGWQEARITDAAYSYNVIVPLTHQLLSRDNWGKTFDIWQKLSRCQCPYYQEAGICRHILSVASKIDWELQQQITKFEFEDVGTSFIDIFEQVNSTQSLNNLLNQFDQLLISSFNPRQLTLLARLSSTLKEMDNLSQQKFFDGLTPLIQTSLKQYESEKKVTRIILDTLKINPEFWWQMWGKFIGQISEYSWTKFLYELFELRLEAGYRQFHPYYQKILKEITNQSTQITKDKIIEKYGVKSSKLDTFEKLYLLAVAINNHKWLEANLEKLDPEKLIKLILVLPIESRDMIDRNIKSQLIQWAAFLPSNQKDEVLNILLKWRNVGEVSEYWYETIIYIKSTVNPKTKLYKELNALSSAS